jgi:hypothetical protein
MLNNDIVPTLFFLTQISTRLRNILNEKKNAFGILSSKGFNLLMEIISMMYGSIELQDLKINQKEGYVAANVFK